MRAWYEGRPRPTLPRRQDHGHLRLPSHPLTQQGAEMGMAGPGASGANQVNHGGRNGLGSRIGCSATPMAEGNCGSSLLLLPGDGGKRGRPARDNRLFPNTVFWILRTGAPRRDLPPECGDWKNTHRGFCRWRDRGSGSNCWIPSSTIRILNG